MRRILLTAVLLAATGPAAPGHALVPTANVRFSVWANAQCSRYYWGSGYLVDGYGQANAGLYTSGLVTGTVNASASSTGAAPSSDSGAADGVLTTSASASAHSDGTPQSVAHNETAGASVRASSPFPGLPSYVGGSMAFSCSTSSSVGYNITKSCDMTYTLNPTTQRWYRSSGSAGTCTVIG